VATDTNPIRAAMVSFENGPNRSRYSWDPLTTLVAVRGAAAASCSECTDCDGKNVIDPNTGSNQWVRGAKTNQTYLILHDAKKAGDTLDALLCQGPKVPTPAPAPPQPTPAPLSGWKEAKGYNCYGTRDGGRSYHGATDLENPVSASCGIMPIAACQQKCEQTNGCTGVTVSKTGDAYACYRKADIDLSKCDQGGALGPFDTWVRTSPPILP